MLGGAALCALVAALSTRPTTSLTEEEKAWIAAHPVVVVGHDPGYVPYSFPGPDGLLVGLDLDYEALIARNTGLRFENRPFPDWQKAMDELKAGRIDMVMSLGRTHEREAYTLYTRPYSRFPNVIVTRTDTPYFLDIRDLKGRLVGVDRAYAGLIEILEKSAPDSTRVEYVNMDDAFTALARGEIDAVIADLVNASYSIKALHLANLRLGSVIAGSEENFIGVRKDLPVLARILDKVVADITPLERRQIDDRWIGLDFAPNRWANVFKAASLVAAIAVVVFLIAFFHNRRLARELTERRRVQLALEQAHAQLALVNKEKSEILHMVAHDLRNPITTFQIGTEMLETQRERLSEDGRQTLAGLGDAVGSMRHMVDNLVEVNEIEEGLRQYSATELDVSALLREAVAAFAETAGRKQIRIALETAAPLLPMRTDPKALRHVLDNLISNAVKYSPPGSEVRIDLRQEASHCRVQVTDQGPGVRPEEREKIFEKYARGSAVPTGGEKSTGLGLWIVRRIVTGLGGQVWCEPSAEQPGSTFVVQLPA